MRPVRRHCRRVRLPLAAAHGSPPPPGGRWCTLHLHPSAPSCPRPPGSRPARQTARACWWPRPARGRRRHRRRRCRGHVAGAGNPAAMLIPILKQMQAARSPAARPRLADCSRRAALYSMDLCECKRMPRPGYTHLASSTASSHTACDPPELGIVNAAAGAGPGNAAGQGDGPRTPIRPVRPVQNQSKRSAHSRVAAEALQWVTSSQIVLIHPRTEPERAFHVVLRFALHATQGCCLSRQPICTGPANTLRVAALLPTILHAGHRI